MYNFTDKSICGTNPDPAPPHLAAHPAGVGLDAGVEPHVPGQHVAPREAPLAHVAEVGLAYRTCRVDILDITGMVEREM